MTPTTARGTHGLRICSSFRRSMSFLTTPALSYRSSAFVAIDLVPGGSLLGLDRGGRARLHDVVGDLEARPLDVDLVGHRERAPLQTGGKLGVDVAREGDDGGAGRGIVPAEEVERRPPRRRAVDLRPVAHLEEHATAERIVIAGEHDVAVGRA